MPAIPAPCPPLLAILPQSSPRVDAARAARAHRDTEHVRAPGRRRVRRRRQPHRLLGCGHRRPALRDGADESGGPAAAHRPGRQHLRDAGRAPSRGLPPILFGSHIDSVPSGGNFDGDLGSLSALGALEALDAAGVRTRHPLEMVVWAHEEGFAFGRGLACSRIVAGDDHAARIWTRSGMACGAAMPSGKIGGNPDRILEARRPKGAHHCYLELHIEQGGTLERAGIPDRRRRRDRRHRQVRRGGHRLRQSRGHDADRGAARCDARGGASDGGGARCGHARAGPPGRHRRTYRGHAELAERHPRAGAPVDRASRSVVRRSSPR